MFDIAPNGDYLGQKMNTRDKSLSIGNFFYTSMFIVLPILNIVKHRLHVWCCVAPGLVLLFSAPSLPLLFNTEPMVKRQKFWSKLTTLKSL